MKTLRQQHTAETASQHIYIIKLCVCVHACVHAQLHLPHSSNMHECVCETQSHEPTQLHGDVLLNGVSAAKWYLPAGRAAMFAPSLAAHVVAEKHAKSAVNVNVFLKTPTM